MTNTIPLFLPASGGNAVPCFFVSGPLQIWVNTGAAGAGEFLGWTRGGVEIQEMNFQAELKSDYSGGEQGPAGDYEWLGHQDSITAELAQWNAGPLAKLARRMNASITSRVKGQLLRCGSANFKILLISLNFVRCYTNVFITEPITYSPIGTPATFPRIVFTCLEDVANTDSYPWNTNGYSLSGQTVVFS